MVLWILISDSRQPDVNEDPNLLSETLASLPPRNTLSIDNKLMLY